MGIATVKRRLYFIASVAVQSIGAQHNGNAYSTKSLAEMTESHSTRQMMTPVHRNFHGIYFDQGSRVGQ